MLRSLLGSASVGCLLCYASAASADPTIDGSGASLATFSSSQSIAFFDVQASPDTNTGLSGTLYLSQDASGNVFFALVQPLGLNSNVYGTTSSLNNLAGAAPYNWANSPTVGHTLNDLLGSDQAEFQFLNTKGTVVFDFKMDYATLVSGTYETCGDNSKCSGDAALVTGTATWLTQYATSLVYDLNQYPSFTTNSPTPAQISGADSNWVNDIIYEGEISNAAFTGSGFGGVQIPLIHDSPADHQKDIQFGACIPGDGTGAGTGECTFTQNQPPGVPEPSSLSELLAGLVVLIGFVPLGGASRRGRLLDRLRACFKGGGLFSAGKIRAPA